MLIREESIEFLAVIEDYSKMIYNIFTGFSQLRLQGESHEVLKVRSGWRFSRERHRRHGRWRVHNQMHEVRAAARRESDVPPPQSESAHDNAAKTLRLGNHYGGFGHYMWHLAPLLGRKLPTSRRCTVVILSLHRTGFFCAGELTR